MSCKKAVLSVLLVLLVLLAVWYSTLRPEVRENIKGEIFMANQENPQALAEQFKTYLGCPCTFFPAGTDQRTVAAGPNGYYHARKRGREEGFVPVLLAVDPLLLENFGFAGDPAEYRAKQLSAPVGSGKEFLAARLKEAKSFLEEDEPGYWDELVGEAADGETIDRFLSLQKPGTWETPIPVLLAEIPVKNPWEVFAYLPFGGWNECPGDEEQMAVAKYWFEQHGAVPALMTPDVLEYALPAVPSLSPEQAMELALEQYAYCNDIVDQGVGTIGRLADGLAGSSCWYFWWD